MSNQIDFLKRCVSLNLQSGSLTDWLDRIEELENRVELLGKLADEATAERDAEIAELVKALDAMRNDSDECLDFDECTAMLVPMDIWHGVFEVLDKVRKL